MPSKKALIALLELYRDRDAYRKLIRTISRDGNTRIGLHIRHQYIFLDRDALLELLQRELATVLERIVEHERKQR